MDQDRVEVPFLWLAGKIFLLSAQIKTIFASLLELSTFLRTLLPSFQLRHSLESSLATVPCDKEDLPDRCTVKNILMRGWIFYGINV